MTGIVASLRRQCQEKPGKLALPEVTDPRVLRAALQLIEEGSVTTIHTLSAPEPVRDLCHAEQLNFTSLTKHCVWLSDDLPQITKTETPVMQAGELLAQGIVEASIAGAVTTTADVVRAAIKTVGLAPGCKTISGSFLMLRPHEDGEQAMLFADCGVVIEPEVSQLVDIAASSVQTWEALTHVPAVVAFLSFSTHGSAAHPLAEKMATVRQQFSVRFPNITCDGEMQFDAAYDRSVGQTKCPDSRVPGHANCFIFPDLNAGNIAYKIAQRLGGFTAIGPLLQGCCKSFNDLSRGASTEDIIIASYIGLMRAR